MSQILSFVSLKARNLFTFSTKNNKSLLSSLHINISFENYSTFFSSHLEKERKNYFFPTRLLLPSFQETSFQAEIHGMTESRLYFPLLRPPLGSKQATGKREISWNCWLKFSQEISVLACLRHSLLPHIHTRSFFFSCLSSL